MTRRSINKLFDKMAFVSIPWSIRGKPILKEENIEVSSKIKQISENLDNIYDFYGSSNISNDLLFRYPEKLCWNKLEVSEFSAKISLINYLLGVEYIISMDRPNHDNNIIEWVSFKELNIEETK